MSPWATLIPGPTPEAWERLTALPGEIAGVFIEEPFDLPAQWTRMRELTVLQMTGTAAELGAGPDRGATEPPPTAEDPDIQELARADVPAMLDLTARTQPGPFLPDTIDFGGYVGIRRDGQLVAMAGRRLHVPGWIEVSAICTDPDHQGQGLARRVTSAVIRGIWADGAQPFLHVMPGNAPAVRLYESLGFVVTRQATITIIGRQS